MKNLIFKISLHKICFYRTESQDETVKEKDARKSQRKPFKNN